jgi:hypothetical protein
MFCIASSPDSHFLAANSGEMGLGIGPSEKECKKVIRIIDMLFCFMWWFPAE